MYKIPDKIKNLIPYEPFQGSFQIRLDANESFMKFSADEIAEAISIFASSINRYPDPYAKGVINAFGELYEVNPKNITAGNGSDELISIIVSCILSKEDKIMAFAPDFSMYFFYPPLYELDLIIEHKDSNMLIDIPKAIKKINSENINAVILSNPCNPTSLGINGAEIKRLVDETNALIVLDEAYMEFWDEKQSLLKYTSKVENLIVLKTCSKSIALAGIRLGFAVSNDKITKALRSAKSPYNVNLLTQAVGEYALLNKKRIKNMACEIRSLIKKLKVEVEALKIKEFIKIYDTAANFLFIETSGENKAAEIFKYLLDNRIAIRKFDKFLRITCGSPSENELLLEYLREYKETC